VENDFWKTLALAKRAMTELDLLNAAACKSMRDTEQRTAKLVAESRELIRKVNAILARDAYPTQKSPDE
jgi:hypothetical protein